MGLVATEAEGSGIEFYWYVRLRSVEEPLIESVSYRSSDLGSKIFDNKEAADDCVAKLNVQLRQKEEEQRKKASLYAAELLQDRKALLTAVKCCIDERCTSCPLPNRFSECRLTLLATLEQLENQ